MQFDIQKLYKTVEAAKAKAPQLAAQIDKAADMLLCNPFVTDLDGGLLILSSNDKTDNIYFTRGGRCNCKAADFKRMCWHRVCDRLVRLYNTKQGH